MKLITRDTDYAVRALCFMAARNNKLLCVSELVEELKIPRPFLRKILQILNKNKILKSYKGQGGGFLLERPAEKVLLVDLIKIFQGPLRLNECVFKKKICPNKRTCILNKKICALEEDVIAGLKSVTIASLLKERA